MAIFYCKLNYRVLYQKERTISYGLSLTYNSVMYHDDVIKWKHFPRNWPFVRGIHWSPVNSPHKGQWRGALMFSLIYVWINGWVNNREAGDLRRHLVHYDVTVMIQTGGIGPIRPILGNVVAISLSEKHLNLKFCEILLYWTIIYFYAPNGFEISYRARQWYYHALCKFLKRMGNWNICWGQTRFREM